MEAKPEDLKTGNGKPESERCERERNALIFAATLIATFVLGFTPDFAGLVSWFLSWRPVQALAFRPR